MDRSTWAVKARDNLEANHYEKSSNAGSFAQRFVLRLFPPLKILICCFWFQKEKKKKSTMTQKCQEKSLALNLDIASEKHSVFSLSVFSFFW